MKPLSAVFAVLLAAAGSLTAAPLPYTVGPDRVVEGSLSARAPDGRTLKSNFTGSEKTWKLSADLSALPRLTAPGSPLVEALWNLSLEEVLKDQIHGGTFDGALSAGAQWPGVWTRDASYAGHLSLAWLFPEAVKASLRAKASGGRIVQDTGTGGAWPVSTDRVVWALAAQEVARATGDAAWMAEAYPLLAASAQADRAVAFDPASGLYYGETSFLDWRDQSYPAWFQPADIFQSPASGTNVLHRALYAALEEWSGLLGRPDAETRTWHDRGEALAQAIRTQLWLPGRGFVLYRYPFTAGGQLSDRTDTLANALAVLTGVAGPEQAAALDTVVPAGPYGPPVFAPQMAHTGPYHNKAVWPFVTAYYGWALQKAGRPGSAAFALEANFRSSALFLTNKENLVAATGAFQGTSVNSDRQLWSAAGQLSGLMRTLFGLELTGQGLTVHPVVPGWVKGPLTLDRLPYRGRLLHLTVTGTGTRILSLTANGRPLDPSAPLTEADLPAPGATLTLAVTLDGDPLPPVRDTPEAAAKGPWDATSLVLNAETRTLTWKTRTGVAKSVVTANGAPVGETKSNLFVLPPAPGPTTVWSITTLGDTGTSATRAEPVLEAPGRVTVTFPDRELGESVGDARTFELTVPRDGRWLVRFHYTNTSGPVSTGNKAAVRTLTVDGGPPAGALVFPQRGYVSTNRGWSTFLSLPLTAGLHSLALTFTPDNTNMDGTVNRAVVDGLEALPLE